LKGAAACRIQPFACANTQIKKGRFALQQAATILKSKRMHPCAENAIR
jgi:hypothetical protein